MSYPLTSSVCHSNPAADPPLLRIACLSVEPISRMVFPPPARTNNRFGERLTAQFSTSPAETARVTHSIIASRGYRTHHFILACGAP